MFAAQPRRGKAPDRKRAERRRDEILEAAARVFAARGYAGTEVQTVADASGIGKGTIYLYFRSKKALFLAAVDRGMRRLRGAYEQAADAEHDPLDQVAAAVRAYLQFFKDHPECAELLILERAEFRDRKQATYFADRTSSVQRWEKLYRQLMARGRVRKVPVSRLIDVLSDLVYGTMFTNRFSGRHKALDVQAEDILDVVFCGILTPAERRRRTRLGFSRSRGK
jgi:AcrR family transcriptional regulator